MNSWVDYEKWLSTDNFKLRDKRISSRNKLKYDQWVYRVPNSFFRKWLKYDCMQNYLNICGTYLTISLYFLA